MTTRRIRPMNLNARQVRRLRETGTVLIVDALKDQPENGLTFLHMTDGVNGHMAVFTDRPPWGWSIPSPYQPGDVVPCRELHPVVESVECRRVNSIDATEVEMAGLNVHSVPHGSFSLRWHRRYRRRGEAFSFDRAFAWFTVLRLESK